VAPSAAFARRTSAAVSSSCARAACAARRAPRSGGCATARATARATEESARLLGALVCGAPADVGEVRPAAADQINAPFNPPKDVESGRAPSRALRLGRQRGEREAG